MKTHTVYQLPFSLPSCLWSSSVLGLTMQTGCNLFRSRCHIASLNINRHDCTALCLLNNVCWWMCLASPSLFLYLSRKDVHVYFWMHTRVHGHTHVADKCSGQCVCLESGLFFPISVLSSLSSLCLLPAPLLPPPPSLYADLDFGIQCCYGNNVGLVLSASPSCSSYSH